jgi:phosphonate transport system substrate-binding protein
MRRYLKGVMRVLALLTLPSMVFAQEYSFAVVPQYTVTHVYRSWRPVLAELERSTGHSFKLLVYPSFRAFETDYLNGVPDFVYFNPYHQVLGYKAQGYLPLVRDGKRKLTGIIVVRKDSGIDSIAQLEGKNIAFPAPNAFAASLYMRALLQEKEGLNFNARYVHSHSNSYRHVYSSKTAAAGGVMSTLIRQPTAVRDALKVIYRTPDYPPHPIAVHPRVPATVRAVVTKALRAMQHTTNGQRLLAGIQMSQPVRADYRRDYAPLGHLGLERYYQPYE